MTALRIQLFPWDSPQAREALRIRVRVFVEEQGVPPEEERPDDADAIAVHALALLPDGEAIGTARLFPAPGEPAGTGRVGRMAVLREHRGTGAGRALLEAMIQEAERRGMRRLVLNAQTHALGFYARLGFVAEGPEFEEAGIPHRRMVRA